MFWKKRIKDRCSETGPEIIAHYQSDSIEITKFRANKPIKPAKSNIKIKNVKYKG